MKQIEIKIYIKGFKKPIATAILSSDKQLDAFKNALNDDSDFIDFYEIIIKKSEFVYATIREINK